MNQLDALKAHTTVVADTGDFHQIARFCPQDATTNPSLILKAVQKEAYAPLLRAAVAEGGNLDTIVDRLLVRFGCEILQLIPGRVSTEVDARLSFDADATVARARHIIDLYRAQGVDPQRVLIKIAATWDGIQAARTLERSGIHTNLTLLFGLPQALACASAGVRLISPFVGRIYDWHKQRAGAQWNEAAMHGAHDPGVRSVRAIYQHYKHYGIATQVMGASFRNTGQILALAGCDLLTIAPELLAQLGEASAPVARALSAQDARSLALPPWNPQDHEGPRGQECLRQALHEDAMASEKLAEGIQSFVADTQRLEALIGAAQDVGGQAAEAG